MDASGSLTIMSNATSSGSLLVTGSVTGNITYKRHIPNTDWHLVAPPISSQSIPVFATDAANAVNMNAANGNYAVSYYQNTNDAGTRWTYHNATPSMQNQEILTNFINGQGYSMNRTAAGDFTFTGGMATDNVVRTLSTTDDTHYWYCIGNPYPSFLPANDNANSTNVLGQNINALDPNFAALYLWNGTAYEAINQTSTALQLSPGQAFMVRAKDNNESFTFTESLQNHQSGTDNFYRNTPSAAPELIVQLSNNSQNKNTTIKYLDNATTGLDVGYDAGTYRDGIPTFSLDTQLVSENQGIDFMLQCLPNNTFESLVVPLSVRAVANQQLSFTAIATNLPQGVDVYLEDRDAHTIKRIDGNTPYQVTLTEALNGVGRFYIHTSQNALQVEDVAALHTISIYKTDPRNLRIVGLEDHVDSKIKMFNIAGKEVLNHNFTAQRVQDIALPQALRTGVYIIQIVSEDKHLTKKIIIE